MLSRGNYLCSLQVGTHGTGRMKDTSPLKEHPLHPLSPLWHKGVHNQEGWEDIKCRSSTVVPAAKTLCSAWAEKWGGLKFSVHLTPPNTERIRVQKQHMGPYPRDQLVKPLSLALAERQGSSETWFHQTPPSPSSGEKFTIKMWVLSQGAH